MRGLLDRSANWFVVRGKDKHGNELRKPTPPPKHILRDMLSLPSWPIQAFPPLDAVITCPIYNSNGQLIDQPGYHLSDRLYYQPDPGLCVPLVPDVVTARGSC